MENKEITFQGKTFKGTPGEFTFTRELNKCKDEDALGSVKGTDYIVAQIWNDLSTVEEAKANAALIANSKNLLEAAVEMYGQLHNHLSSIHFEIGCMNELEASEQATKDLAPFAETINKSFI